MNRSAARESLKYVIRNQKSVSTSKLEVLMQEMGLYTKQGETLEERRLHRELQSVKDSRDFYKKKVKRLENKIGGMHRKQQQENNLGSRK